VEKGELKRAEVIGTAGSSVKLERMERNENVGKIVLTFG